MWRAICFFIVLSLGHASDAPEALNSTPEMAYVNPYHVDGIVVSLPYSHEARLKAIHMAQREAFDVIKTRFDMSQDSIEGDIDGLIKDVEVRQEKITPHHYEATFLVRFKENSIKKLFKIKEKEILPPTGKGWVVIPLMKTEEKVLLFEEDNRLLTHFRTQPELYEAHNLTLPLGDLEDIQALNPHKVMAYDKNTFIQFLERYKIAQGLLIIYEEPIAHLSIYSITMQGLALLMEKTVSKYMLFKKLPHDIDTILTQAPPVTSLVQLKMTLQNVQEFNTIHTLLKKTPFIENIKITALTPQGVTFNFKLNGQRFDLEKVLSTYTLKGTWPHLTASTSQP